MSGGLLAHDRYKKRTMTAEKTSASPKHLTSTLQSSARKSLPTVAQNVFHATPGSSGPRVGICSLSSISKIWRSDCALSSPD